MLQEGDHSEGGAEECRVPGGSILWWRYDPGSPAPGLGASGSAQDVVYRQRDRFEEERRKGVTAAGRAHFGVPVGARFAVDLDSLAWEAHQPSFGDAGARVQGNLHVTVVIGWRVRHL